MRKAELVRNVNSGIRLSVDDSGHIPAQTLSNGAFVPKTYVDIGDPE